MKTFLLGQLPPAFHEISSTIRSAGNLDTLTWVQVKTKLLDFEKSRGVGPKAEQQQVASATVLSATVNKILRDKGVIGKGTGKHGKHGGSKFQGSCNTCGKWGHKKADCNGGKAASKGQGYGQGGGKPWQPRHQPSANLMAIEDRKDDKG